jgi:tetratricopeptide (TPR) repeat protein
VDGGGAGKKSHLCKMAKFVHNVFTDVKDKSVFEQIVEQCDQAIASGHASWEHFHCKGKALFSLGKHRDALLAFNLSLERNKEKQTMWLSKIGKADSLSKLGRGVEALEIYDDAESYLSLKERSEIVEKRLDLLRSQSKSRQAEYWALRGLKCMEVRELHGAGLDAFDHALEIQPDLAAAHCWKGILLEKTGRNVEALKEFETALKLDGDFDEAELGRDEALDRLRSYSKCIPSTKNGQILDVRGWNPSPMVKELLGKSWRDWSCPSKFEDDLSVVLRCFSLKKSYPDVVLDYCAVSLWLYHNSALCDEETFARSCLDYLSIINHFCMHQMKRSIKYWNFGTTRQTIDDFMEFIEVPDLKSKRVLQRPLANVGDHKDASEQVTLFLRNAAQLRASLLHLLKQIDRSPTVILKSIDESMIDLKAEGGPRSILDYLTGIVHLKMDHQTTLHSLHQDYLKILRCFKGRIKRIVKCPCTKQNPLPRILLIVDLLDSEGVSGTLCEVQIQVRIDGFDEKFEEFSYSILDLNQKSGESVSSQFDFVRLCKSLVELSGLGLCDFILDDWLKAVTAPIQLTKKGDVVKCRFFRSNFKIQRVCRIRYQLVSQEDKVALVLQDEIEGR